MRCSHTTPRRSTAHARKGKLVATSRASGRLPNPIIAKAPDANLLDGLNSTAFLPAAGKAADSELLDGLDSADFVRGGGTVAREHGELAPGESHAHTTPLSTVQYGCPKALSLPGSVTYRGLLCSRPRLQRLPGALCLGDQLNPGSGS